MTDNLQNNQTTEQVQPTAPVEPTTDAPVDNQTNDLKLQEEKAEDYLQQNQGFISGLLSKIPAPICAIIKGILKLILLPLRILAILPFRGLYTFLNNFVNK